MTEKRDFFLKQNPAGLLTRSIHVESVNCQNKKKYKRRFWEFVEINDRRVNDPEAFALEKK